MHADRFSIFELSAESSPFSPAAELAWQQRVEALEIRMEHLHQVFLEVLGPLQAQVQTLIGRIDNLRGGD